MNGNLAFPVQKIRPGSVRGGAFPVTRRSLLALLLAWGDLSLRAASAQERPIPQFNSDGYQFTILDPQQQVPSLRLFRLKGGTLELQSLRGKPVLLNFWASWCAACRQELPVLDRLYRGPFRDKLHVLAVSEDRSDRRTVEKFINELGITAIPVFLDPHGYAAYSDLGNRKSAPFALYGMPITYAIAASGTVVGYMPGAADWAAPPAMRLIEYLLEV
ncbi:Thiol:disulfide interchange protein TlpA [subsurface metagenome]